MKIFATLVLIATLSSLAVPAHLFTHPSALSVSQQLFVPIACTSPQMFRWKTGTGFPVGPHLVMTAKHIDCHAAFGPDAVTEISDDGGLHWVVVPDSQNDAYADLDVRIYWMPSLHFNHVAKFRSPVLGENVTGYGVAFGETADFGRVIKIEAALVYSSSTAIGGMSGSAMVADDGQVIGIAVEGVPTIIGPGVESSWVSAGPAGAVLQAVLDGYHKHFGR